MIGQILGNYKIVEEIGHGELSTVYKGIRLLDEQLFALKVLHIENLVDPTVRARYQREVQMIAAMDMPVIVPVYEYTEQEDVAYIVMKYMEGGNLAQRLQQSFYTFDEAFGVLAVLAPVLDAIHQLGIVHGDIKPSNILFDASGQVYLSDFGMLKIAEASIADRLNVLIGPPAYSSPEQISGIAEIDGRSDIYMLGILLYEMLSGRLPYESGTSLSLVTQRMIKPLPSLHEQNPDLPSGVDTVLQVALANSPEERFTTVSEMVSALEQVESLPLPAPQVEVTLPDPIAPRPEPQYVYLKQPKVKRKKQKRRFHPFWFLFDWFFIALLLFVAISGYALLVTSPFKGFLDTLFATPVVVAVNEAPTLTLTPSPTASLTPTTVPTLSPNIFQPLEPTIQPTIFITPTYPVPTPEKVKVYSSAIITQSEVLTTTYDVVNITNLFNIAGQFHISYDMLINANSMSCDTFLPLGMPLLIPGAPAYTYTLSSPPLDPLGTIQLRLEIILPCNQAVGDLAFSPDGKTLAVASNEDIFLWSVGEWKPFLQLKGHLSAINKLDWSSDSLTLVSGSDDTSIRLWDTLTGQQLKVFYGHSGPVSGVDFTSDGANLISSSLDGEVRLWKLDGTLETKKRVGPVYSQDYAPDGKTLALGLKDDLLLLSATDLKQLGKLPSNGIVENVGFSTDSALVATNLDIWQVDLQTHLFTLAGRTDDVAFVPDNQMIAYGRELIKVANNESLRVLENPHGHQDRTIKDPLELDFRGDGGLLAIGGIQGVSIWSMPRGYQESVVPDSEAYVADMRDTLFNITTDQAVLIDAFMKLNNLSCNNPIFPSQQLLIPKNDDAKVYEDSRIVAPLSGDTIANIKELSAFQMECVKTKSYLSFSGSSRFLIGGSAMWLANTGAPLFEAADVPRKLDGKPEVNLDSPIMLLSPDEKILAVRIGKNIELWDAQSGRYLDTLKGHQDVVTSVDFSLNGKYLASSGGLEDKNIRIWNMSTMKTESRIEGIVASQVFFSADGKALIIRNIDGVRYWRIGAVEPDVTLFNVEGVIEMAPDRSKFAFINCLQFSGRTCLNEVAIIYDFNQQQRSVYQGFTEKIQALAFSSDGQYLAGGSSNSVVVWRVSDRETLQILRTERSADIIRLTFSPDTTLVAAIDSSNNLRIWQVIGGNLLVSFLDQDVRRVAFSPDNKLLALLIGDSIRLWGVTNP